MMGKCTFQDGWLQDKRFKDWIQKVGDKHSARCGVCDCLLNIASMGEAVLKQHMGTAKHKRSVRQHDSDSRCSVADFLTSGRSGLDEHQQSNPQSRSVQPTPSTSSSTSSFNIDNAKLKAEILWAMKSTAAHFSFRSSEGTSDLFKAMFPDSEIASRFQCGETRCRYLVTFGLAPRFLDMLQSTVRATSDTGYVLLFDESLNKDCQMKQMDVMIRLWHDSEIETRYLTSEFLGHATASDVTERFESVFSQHGLNKANLLQVGMDGPNVNWSIYNTINCDLLDNHGVSLLHAGSCGLHTLHNAFRRGCEASGWDIEQVISSAWTLLHDCPARVEDYYLITGATVLPLKFCRHRWLENEAAANRLIELVPAFQLFVKAAEEKKITTPQNASYRTLKQAVLDNPLLLCQVSFFAFVARHVEPFLKRYQADRPLTPFLAEDLHALIRSLMQCFMTEESLSGCSSSRKLMDIDVQDKKNHLRPEQVELGFKTSSLLQKAKKDSRVSEKMVTDFRKECKNFLIELVHKLTAKCPLKYSIVRNMACLDPRKLTDKEDCKKKMKNVLRCLIDSKRVRETEADLVLEEYITFIQTTAQQNSASSFDPIKDRIDTWFFDTLSQKPEYKNLFLLVKKLLLLSHGQATVERGFSYNKEVTANHLSQLTLKARRTVIDHIHSVGGLLKVKIDKPLLVSAGAAWGRYDRHLDEQRKSRESTARQQKRKAIEDEIQGIKKRKTAPEKDAKHLLMEADSLSFKAQHQSSLRLLGQANELRLSSKDKQDTVDKLQAELTKKEEELKKCH